jgi:hypothetical protein
MYHDADLHHNLDAGVILFLHMSLAMHDATEKRVITPVSVQALEKLIIDLSKREERS